MKLIITKSYMDVEKFLIKQDDTGIHCHQLKSQKFKASVKKYYLNQYKY